MPHLLKDAVTGHLRKHPTSFRLLKGASVVTLTAGATQWRDAWWYEYVARSTQFLTKDSHLADLKNEWDSSIWQGPAFPWTSVAARFRNFSEYGSYGGEWGTCASVKVFAVPTSQIGKTVTGVSIQIDGFSSGIGAGEARLAVGTASTTTFPASYAALSAMPCVVVPGNGTASGALNFVVQGFIFIIGYWENFEGRDVDESRRYSDYAAELPLIQSEFSMANEATFSF